MKNLGSNMESTRGLRKHELNLVEEMKEFRKLRTTFMMEKCLVQNEALACPKPMKRHIRQTSGDCSVLKVGGEISDIFCSKASPPYFSGSPPVRSSNPLVQDVCFKKQASATLALY